MKATVELGYPEGVVVGLGIDLTRLHCPLFDPADLSLLGAILLTNHLGGAVATRVRVGARLFPIAFPILRGARAAGALATP